MKFQNFLEDRTDWVRLEDKIGRESYGLESVSGPGIQQA